MAMDEETQQPLLTTEGSSIVTAVTSENMNVVDGAPEGALSAAEMLTAEEDASSPILPNDEVPSSVDDPIIHSSSDHKESAPAPGNEELESLMKQETETADAMAEFVTPPPPVVEKPRKFLGLRLGRGKHRSTSSASATDPTDDAGEKENSKEAEAKNKQDEESVEDEEEEESENSSSLCGSEEEDDDEEEDQEQELIIPQKRWGIPFRRNHGVDSNDPSQPSEEEEEEEEGEDVLPSRRGWFRGAEETRPREAKGLLRHDTKSQSVRSLGKMEGIGYQDASFNNNNSQTIIKKTQSMHSMPGIGGRGTGVVAGEVDHLSNSDSRLEWKGGTSKNSLESMRVTTMDKKNERTWGDALKGVASALIFPEKAVAEMMDGDESDDKLGQYHFVGVDDSSDEVPKPTSVESPGFISHQELTVHLVKHVRSLDQRMKSLEKEVRDQELINTTWRARVETLEAELRRSNNGTRQRTTSSDSDGTSVPVYNDEEDDGIEEMEPMTKEGILLDLNDAVAPGDKIADLIPTEEGILLDLNDAVAPGNKIADLVPTEEVDLIDLEDRSRDSNSPEAKQSTKVLIPILDTGSRPETGDATNNIPVL